MEKRRCMRCASTNSTRTVRRGYARLAERFMILNEGSSQLDFRADPLFVDLSDRNGGAARGQKGPAYVFERITPSFRVADAP